MRDLGKPGPGSLQEGDFFRGGEEADFFAQKKGANSFFPEENKVGQYFFLL